jgi:hypothetical protein
MVTTIIMDGAVAVEVQLNGMRRHRSTSASVLINARRS